MANSNDLGVTVKRLRESVGITQEELAHRVGIERSYLSHIERGKKKPPPEIFLTLLETLGAAGAQKVETDALLADYVQPTASLPDVLTNLVKSITQFLPTIGVKDIHDQTQEAMFALYFTHRLLNNETTWKQLADGSVDHTRLTAQLAGLIFIAPETELSLLTYQFAACRRDMEEVWRRFNARYDAAVLRALEYARRVLEGSVAVVDLFVNEAVEHDVRVIRGLHKFTPSDHYNGEIYPTLQFLLTSPEISADDPIRPLIENLIQEMGPKIRDRLG